MSLAPPETIGPLRRERLRTARLYFVLRGAAARRGSRSAARAALRGGVDIVQLREKSLRRREIARSARPSGASATPRRALHRQRRSRPGPRLRRRRRPPRTGRHARGRGPRAPGPGGDHRALDPLQEQIDAARPSSRSTTSASGRSGRRRPKRGGPAVGLELIEYAAGKRRPCPSSRSAASTSATSPRWSAAGASRLGVVRAIRDAEDPAGRRARALREALAAPGTASAAVADAGAEAQANGGAGPPPRERMERGYARAEERNREAREALEPLAEGERPVVGHGRGGDLGADRGLDRRRLPHRGRGQRRETATLAADAASPALLMGTMAWGMWRARYWAVLGFQMILVLLIFGAVFGLAVQAATRPPGDRRTWPCWRSPGRSSASWSRRWPGSRCRRANDRPRRLADRLRLSIGRPMADSYDVIVDRRRARAATWPRSAPPSSARRPRSSSATSPAGAASTTPASRPRRCCAPPSSTTRSRNGAELGVVGEGRLDRLGGARQAPRRGLGVALQRGEDALGQEQGRR